MAKVKNAVAVAQPAVVVAPVAAPVLYALGKLPRNGLGTNTKYGTTGNNGSYAALVAFLQANGGSAPLAAIGAHCVATAGAKRTFVNYCVRNHWLLPVQPVAS